MVVKVIANTVTAKVPDTARPLEKYYSTSYVAQCMETDQVGVEIGWELGADGLFAPPEPIAEVVTTEEIAIALHLGMEIPEEQLAPVAAQVTAKLRKQDLTAIPTPGEEWRETANYIEGDTVVRLGAEYTALKYSRNKSPESSAQHWQVKETEVVHPTWDSIEDGAQIVVGTIVTHDGRTWQASKQHFKSVVYAPKEGSSRWDEVV